MKLSGCSIDIPNPFPDEDEAKTPDIGLGEFVGRLLVDVRGISKDCPRVDVGREGDKGDLTIINSSPPTLYVWPTVISCLIDCDDLTLRSKGVDILFLTLGD
jgi:hypothetical protein